MVFSSFGICWVTPINAEFMAGLASINYQQRERNLLGEGYINYNKIISSFVTEIEKEGKRERRTMPRTQIVLSLYSNQ